MNSETYTIGLDERIESAYTSLRKLSEAGDYKTVKKALDDLDGELSSFLSMSSVKVPKEYEENLDYNGLSSLRDKVGKLRKEYKFVCGDFSDIIGIIDQHYRDQSTEEVSLSDSGASIRETLEVFNGISELNKFCDSFIEKAEEYLGYIPTDELVEAFNQLGTDSPLYGVMHGLIHGLDAEYLQKEYGRSTVSDIQNQISKDRLLVDLNAQGTEPYAELTRLGTNLSRKCGLEIH